jgi:hypothetical protein
MASDHDTTEEWLAFCRQRRRYATWEEAEAGHREIVDRLAPRSV